MSTYKHPIQYGLNVDSKCHCVHFDACKGILLKSSISISKEKKDPPLLNVILSFLCPVGTYASLVLF